VFPAGTRTAGEWFNAAAFSSPAPYTFGNAGRNTVEGPGLQNAEVALFREFDLGEWLHVRRRAEMFNALNNADYGSPNRSANEPPFGTVTMSTHGSCEAQSSARITF